MKTLDYHEFCANTASREVALLILYLGRIYDAIKSSQELIRLMCVVKKFVTYSNS